jgi:hypothetical protein
VEIVDRLQDLFDSLRSILLGKLSIFTNPIEQLASGCELGYYIIFILASSASKATFKRPCNLLATQTSHET